ncbi:MAG TPA: lysylphosphatidylglycerol synthase domain-containing protein, partial [Thermomicrobiales bacterium]|nr:lysylphosphatidylglycerol synthase domain-containing protein [Thermomicrobiales bacterium]
LVRSLVQIAAASIHAFAHRLRRVDNVVWVVLVAVLGIAFIWNQRTNVRQIVDVVRNANGWWLLAVFAAAIGLHLGFVFTQSLILETLGHRIPFLPAVTTYAERQVVATVVPLGSAPSLVVLARRLAPFGVTNQDAVYSVLLFSLIGHSSFIIYLLPVLLWLILSHHATTAIIGAAILLMAVVMLAVGFAAALLSNRGIPAGLRARFPASVERFLDSVRGHNLRPRDLSPACLVALSVDGFGVLAIFLALHAVGSDASLGVAAVGYAVGTLFLLIAPVFQGIGVVEFSMTVVLQQLGVPASQALGATLIYRVAVVWLPVLFGIAFQARHQKRLIGYPARLPAIWTGVNGLIAILSVMPHPTYRRISDIRRPEDVAQFDVVHLHNVSRSITLTIGFLLILLSFGLWRRQRTAWLAAVILSAIVVVSHFLKGHDHIGGFLALASIVPLLIYRDRFRVRSDRPTIQRGLTFSTAAIVLALAYGIFSLWFLDRHQFGYDFSLWSSIRQTVDLYTSVNSAGLMPQTLYAHWLVNSFHL